MPHIIVCEFDFSPPWFRPTYRRHVSLKPYLCSSRRIRSIKPVGLSIQKIKFGQIIKGSSGFLPLLQFLQNHLILISEKINRHQIPPRSSVRISFKWKQNFLKTRIVSLNILPNRLQNDQIHVTGDRGIVLMRNLLAPLAVLFRYLCRISVCISLLAFPPICTLSPLGARYLGAGQTTNTRQRVFHPKSFSALRSFTSCAK